MQIPFTTTTAFCHHRFRLPPPPLGDSGIPAWFPFCSGNYVHCYLVPGGISALEQWALPPGMRFSAVAGGLPWARCHRLHLPYHHLPHLPCILESTCRHFVILHWVWSDTGLWKILRFCLQCTFPPFLFDTIHAIPRFYLHRLTYLQITIPAWALLPPVGVFDTVPIPACYRPGGDGPLMQLLIPPAECGGMHCSACRAWITPGSPLGYGAG